MKPEKPMYLYIIINNFGISSINGFHLSNEGKSPVEKYTIIKSKYNGDVCPVRKRGYHPPRLSILLLAIVKSNVSER